MKQYKINYNGKCHTVKAADKECAIRLVKAKDKVSYDTLLANFGFAYLGTSPSGVEKWYYRDNDDTAYKKAIDRIRTDRPKLILSSSNDGRRIISVLKDANISDAEDVRKLLSKVDSKTGHTLQYAIDDVRKYLGNALGRDTAIKVLMDAFNLSKQDIVNAINYVCDKKIINDNKTIKDAETLFVVNKVLNGKPVEASVIKHRNGYTVQSSEPKDDKDFQLLEQAKEYLTKKGYKIMDRKFKVHYKDRHFLVSAKDSAAAVKAVKKIVDRKDLIVGVTEYDDARLAEAIKANLGSGRVDDRTRFKFLKIVTTGNGTEYGRWVAGIPGGTAYYIDFKKVPSGMMYMGSQSAPKGSI